MWGCSREAWISISRDTCLAVRGRAGLGWGGSWLAAGLCKLGLLPAHSFCLPAPGHATTPQSRLPAASHRRLPTHLLDVHGIHAVAVVHFDGCVAAGARADAVHHTAHAALPKHLLHTELAEAPAAGQAQAQQAEKSVGPEQRPRLRAAPPALPAAAAMLHQNVVPAAPTRQGWSPCFNSGGQAAVSMMVRVPSRELLAARATAARLLLRPPPPPAGIDRLAPLDCTAGPFVMASGVYSSPTASRVGPGGNLKAAQGREWWAGRLAALGGKAAPNSDFQEIVTQRSRAGWRPRSAQGRSRGPRAGLGRLGQSTPRRIIYAANARPKLVPHAFRRALRGLHPAATSDEGPSAAIQVIRCPHTLCELTAVIRAADGTAGTPCARLFFVAASLPTQAAPLHLP